MLCQHITKSSSKSKDLLWRTEHQLSRRNGQSVCCLSYGLAKTFNWLIFYTKFFNSLFTGINQYIVAFFIGIIIGYLVNHQLIYKRLNFTRQTEVYLWVVSFFCLFAVCYWFNSLHRINQAAPRVSILLWFSVGKLMACITIAWMLFSLCVGRAGKWPNWAAQLNCPIIKQWHSQ